MSPHHCKANPLVRLGRYTMNNYSLRTTSLAVAYMSLARLGQTVALVEGTVSPFWPASGLAIAALALWGLRLWPAVAIGALVANFLIVGNPIAVAAGIAAGNTLEALAGAWVLRRMKVQGEISSVRDAAVLLAVELLAPIPSFTVGAISMYLGGMVLWENLPWVCTVWWLGNSLGAFIVLPLILAWAGQRVSGDYPSRPGELVGATVSVVVLTTLAYFYGNALNKLGVPVFPPAIFLFPPIIWALLRLRPRHTILVMAIGSTFAVYFALARMAGGQNIGPLLFLHLVLVSAGSGWLILFGATAERKQADLLITQSEQRLELAVGGAGLGLWDWQVSTGELAVNDSWRSMLGLDPAGPMPTIDLWNSLIHVDDLPKLDQLFNDVIMNPTGRDFEIEIRARHQDGHYLWIFDKGHVAERAADGSPLRVVGTHLDNSARKSAAEVLLHYQDLLASAEKMGRVGGWEIDIQTQQTTWTEGVYDIYELDGTDRLSVDEGISYYTPASQPIIEQAVQRAIEQGEPFDLELDIITAKGNRRNVHAVGKPDLARGKVSGFFQDITERKRAEKSLQQAATVFGHTREGITITSKDGTILDVNEAFTRITGYSRKDAIGQNTKILSSGRQSAEFYKEMWDALTAQGYWSGEIWNRRKDGEVYAELLSISAIRDEQGVTQQYVALFSDITAIKAHQSQLEHMAHFDALTNLPNRFLLADRLRQAMAQAQRRQQHLVVVYLDLDGFKAINDQYGHETGDQALIVLAKRFKEALREGDTLARISGDEFVAVLADLEDTSASLPLLNRLRAAAALPVALGELSLSLSASLGVTFYPQAQDIDGDQLLRQADQAMYQAKVAGKNRYYIFDAAVDSNVRKQNERLARIRLALERQEFILYYQPKVNMRTGKVIGAEALIRWQHPEDGLLAPAAFLPTIEDHPLAVDVGEWVIDTAMRQMEVWHAAGLDLPVSVNIGARQLLQDDFVERLQRIVAKHPKVHPGCIELEVLETSALADMAQASKVIEDCAEIGVSFALDDFGTGYSSLTYLKRLQVTQLKIDQSFVSDMLDDPNDLAILQGIIGLAAAFDREVIAEGVETVEHGTALLQLGCELAQGYGIARPMPPDQLPAWAASWQPDAAWGAVMSPGEAPRSTVK